MREPDIPTIEKGIVVPTKRRRYRYDKMLQDMGVDDSILAEDKGQAVTIYNRATMLGFKLTMEKQPSGKVRLWKVR